jgi:hypothetical protein
MYKPVHDGRQMILPHIMVSTVIALRRYSQFIKDFVGSCEDLRPINMAARRRSKEKQKPEASLLLPAPSMNSRQIRPLEFLLKRKIFCSGTVPAFRN